MELVNENLIRLDIDVDSKTEIIHCIADILEHEGRLNDKALFISDVYKREEEVPTAMGMDIAIPHARSQGVKITSLVYLRLTKPVMWNEEKVSMIFGIAVPQDENSCNNEYLKLLSKLARKLMDENFRVKLLHATKKDICSDLLTL